MIAIDATEYSVWDREVLQEMKDGGLTAVNVTLVIWENARETLDIIGQWHQRFKDHADLILQAAAASGADLRVSEAARTWLTDAQGAGWGDQDYSAVLAYMLDAPE